MHMLPDPPQLTADVASTHSSFCVQHPTQLAGLQVATGCGQPVRTTAVKTNAAAESEALSMPARYLHRAAGLNKFSLRLTDDGKRDAP
jgi:hypothetical protein